MQFRNTALMCAAWKGHLNIVKWLVQANADVNIQNKAGETALMNAVQCEHLKIVQFLIVEAKSVYTITNSVHDTIHSIYIKYIVV